MAVKTLYFQSSFASGSSGPGLMNESAPGAAATMATGWAVGTNAANNRKVMTFGTESARTSGWSTTSDNVDTGTFTSGATDCFRTGQLIGRFAATAWAFSMSLIATTGGAFDGRLRYRVWKSANADGSSPTLLSSAVIDNSGSNVLNLTTTAQTVTASWTPAAVIDLNNEYLFVQVDILITGAGGANTHNVRLRVDPTNSKITTSDFTPGALGTLTATESGSDTAAIVGSVQTPSITGTLAATESGTDTAAITGGVFAGLFDPAIFDPAIFDTGQAPAGPTMSAVWTALADNAQTVDINSGGTIKTHSTANYQKTHWQSQVFTDSNGNGFIEFTCPTVDSDQRNFGIMRFVPQGTTPQDFNGTGRSSYTENPIELSFHGTQGEFTIEENNAAYTTANLVLYWGGPANVVRLTFTSTTLEIKVDGVVQTTYPLTMTMTHPISAVIGGWNGEEAFPVYYELTSVKLSDPNASAGVTGTITATESGTDTAAIIATVNVSGTLAATETLVDTAAIAGQVKVQGSLVGNESGIDTASIVAAIETRGALAATELSTDSAAIFANVVVSGTLTAAEVGNDTSVIAGSVSAAGVSGTLAATETGTDTAAIVASVVISGTLNATEVGNDSAAIAGQVKVQGSVVATETGNDTASVAAQVKVQGALAATEVSTDSAAIAGNVVISGALAATEIGNDTVVIPGTIGPAGVAGTLAATEAGADTGSLVATIGIAGVLAATETNPDTAAILGAVKVSGALAATETGADVAAIGAGVTVSGSLAAVEAGSDTVAIGGTVIGAAVSGTLAATETGADVVSVVATVGPAGVAGILTAVETGNDTAVILGNVKVSGAIAATETGTDIANIAGQVKVSGALAASELGIDTAIISGGIAPPVTGTVAATETAEPDQAIIAGVVKVSGSVVATESAAPDTAAILGSVLIAGSLDAVETGVDTVSISGNVGPTPIVGTVAGIETSPDVFVAVVEVINPLPSISVYLKGHFPHEAALEGDIDETDLRGEIDTPVIIRGSIYNPMEH